MPGGAGEICAEPVHRIIHVRSRDLPVREDPRGTAPDQDPTDGRDTVPEGNLKDLRTPRPVSLRRYSRTIIDGPIRRAVWTIAWPTMLQNIIGGMQGIGGLQGLVDHAMVGHYVGYTGNAAIGVSWQIFLVVVVFISSLFAGMGVLVARFTGAGKIEKVNRSVYQAFLTAAFLSVGVLAPLGYVLAPSLLQLVNAAPEVQVEALPYLRIMFLFSFGMMMFFMTGGAFRSAGDAQTPLRLGVLMTVLNIILNVILIRGLGPIPAFGTAGAAMGTVIAGGVISLIVLWIFLSGSGAVGFPRGGPWRPDWAIIRELFRFGLPTGIQGIAMNLGGVFLLRFIGSLAQSAEAQAAYAVSYTQLFSFITWTSVGLMSAAAAVGGQNLGAGRPAERIFGMTDPVTVGIAVQLLRYLTVSGVFVCVALTYTGGLQGTGDTKGPLYISMVSQVVIPLGFCWVVQGTRGLHAGDIWLAIVLGHVTRAGLSVLRFRQGKWREIEVRVG